MIKDLDCEETVSKPRRQLDDEGRADEYRRTILKLNTLTGLKLHLSKQLSVRKARRL